MRVRFGVAMPRKGGRTAVVGVEVKEAPAPDGRLAHSFVVGSIDRVSPPSVSAARDRVLELVDGVMGAPGIRPCVIVDVSTAQGIALLKALRESDWPDTHRPHAFAGHGPDREQLFAAFLGAYSAERIRFRPGLKHRADMDKALVFHNTGGTGRTLKTEGIELSSEDEALVSALGLAMTWPKHGPDARRS